jgi:hypothetical protein
MGDLLKIQKFLLVKAVKGSSVASKAKPIDLAVTAVDLDQVDGFQSWPTYQEATTPGYFVFSTAPFNVEDGEADLVVDQTPAMQEWSLAHPGDIQWKAVRGRSKLKLPVRAGGANQEQESIKAIAQDLIRAAGGGDSAELVIAIHGYSTEQTNVRRWYKRIFQYVNQSGDQANSPFEGKKNLVFVGYRWSSERPEIKWWSIGAALKALPIILRVLPILPLGLLLIILPVVVAFKWFSLIPTLLVILALSTVSVISIVLSLVILRVIVYFRDNYRANNFAVPDLVELIRQLDRMIQSELDRDPAMVGEFRVNLNFVAHSMGAFVATNAIRILSNVFDPAATDKVPTSKIGNIFCLKRLVLVSPDISTLAIENTRANFLASSLRRFDEAYLFSNEGDLALRLASTAANYFSFPANTRKSGYRLGNVTINPVKHPHYGIVNLAALAEIWQICPPESDQQWFEAVGNSTTASALNSLSETCLDPLSKQDGDSNRLTIADLFTYVDCTDYIEVVDQADDLIKRFLQENRKYHRFIKRFNLEGAQVQALGVLSRANGVSRPKPKGLNFLDYALLILDFLLGRDVHGGYFAAPFTQKLIYQLAFLGFHETISSYDSDPNLALNRFEQDCKRYWLQVLLSPLHYKAYRSRDKEFGSVKKELIEYIKAAEDEEFADPTL